MTFHDLECSCSTPDEQKLHNNHTGVVFRIDLANMKQINKKSGFARNMLREEHTAEVIAPVVAPAAAAALADVRMSINNKGRWGKSAKMVGAVNRTSTRTSAIASKPAEIAAEDSLILYAGQLLQTSKQRPDGWAFGSVVLDVMADRPPIGVDGMSTQAGWFPLERTAMPSPDELSGLQKKMGGGEGANEALKPPDAWQAVKDPLHPDIITLSDGAEKTKVVNAFMSTLGPHIKVQGVQRIQNMSMWQSYAVKRQTVLQREKDDAANQGAKSQSRYERVWLFHGTDDQTVPKIIEMGFNRSFCGKNATAFGKGGAWREVERWTSASLQLLLFPRAQSLSCCVQSLSYSGQALILLCSIPLVLCSIPRALFDPSRACAVYFARDSSYSSSTTYSRPDGNGVQHMFLVRVVVGEYCMGKRDQLTPDVRQGHQLYDTTVNNMNDPSMYVTYHDAQAYPEYLVKFKQ